MPPMHCACPVRCLQSNRSGHSLQALMLLVQINNGVYKSGFSTKQAAYERAQAELYAALDQVESRLSQHRFLVGDR